MKYLYLAEKPSTMNAVKKVYDQSSKPLGEIDFFALSGHICKLCEPKEYEDWDVKWKDRTLPMVPPDFKVGVINKAKVSELSQKLKQTSYDGIIVGTDSDVEGNGIYDLVEQYLGLQKYKALRFFETDLTPKGIMDSMSKLTDYHSNPRDVGMTESFRIRSRFDWLIGFNMTVAYTVKSGFLMKVGRVKAPTLKLVYDNCTAIDNFNSKTSYQPQIKTENPEITALLIDEDNKPLTYITKDEANKIIETFSGTVKVESFEKQKIRKQPNQLYKLSDIQYEAGQKFGYTPSRTLEIIQNLYEKYKVISYPRTDGRYVSQEKSKDFPQLLDAVKSIPELKDIAERVTSEDILAVQSNKRFVNDVEVAKTSHDALIPTGNTSPISSLPTDEKNICTMIFRRFLSIFLPPLDEEKTKVILNDNGNRFVATGSKVLNAGYTKLYQIPKDTPLPEVVKGQELKTSETQLHEVVTKPPTRFTQSSLIKAMENVQKYMSAGQLKDTMKKVGGIGQPSSRDSIISDLISTGYIEDVKSGKGKGLHITESGKAYIENLGDSSLVNPELSAQWEVYMNDIRSGERKYSDVYEMILEYTKTTLDELNKIKIKKINTKNREIIGKCPKCGRDVVKLPKGCGCSGYPECDFSIITTVAGKKLTDKNVKDLLTGKETDVIDGFINKKGKKFQASLMLDENKKIVWAPFEKDTNYKCPKCGKKILKTPIMYKCSDDDCGFVLWKSFGGRMLSNNQVENLLQGKPTGIIKGLKRKDGTTFDASLVIKDGKLVFESRRAEVTNYKCPKCGKSIISTDRTFECEGRKDKSCDFSIWKILPGGLITEKDLNDLIENKKTELKHNLKSKSGKNFDAYIILDENFKTKMEFPNS